MKTSSVPGQQVTKNLTYSRKAVHIVVTIYRCGQHICMLVEMQNSDVMGNRRHIPSIQ